MINTDIFEFLLDNTWVPFSPDEQSMSAMAVPPYLVLPDD